MKKATQLQTKEHNRSLVLTTIFNHLSISRAEIARITRLTRTTVSDIVGALIDEGLVSEAGVGDSTGGKPSILLNLEANSRYLIALDLAQSEFRGAIVNLRGQVMTSVSAAIDDLCGDEALDKVYALVEELMKHDFTPLVGIGVGTPGLVNCQKGVVVRAVNLDWEDLPLAELLKARYHLPVVVLNDSQAAAMGEYTYGSKAKPESNLVVVNVRHGIGAGIIIGGHLFEGDGGGAGEIGHTSVVQHGGQLCRCGNYGCLETVASAKELLRQVRKLVGQRGVSLPRQPGQDITIQDICTAFERGEPTIQKLVLDTGRYMGMGLATLVGILNIRRIVISGDMTCFGEPWLEAIRQSLSGNSLPRMARETRVEIGSLGKDSILLGASAVLVNNHALLYLNKS
jgi:predicted NBD/HSP70 family sugar kinase